MYKQQDDVNNAAEARALLKGLERSGSVVDVVLLLIHTLDSAVLAPGCRVLHRVDGLAVLIGYDHAVDELLQACLLYTSRCV